MVYSVATLFRHRIWTPNLDNVALLRFFLGFISSEGVRKHRVHQQHAPPTHPRFDSFIFSKFKASEDYDHPLK